MKDKFEPLHAHVHVNLGLNIVLQNQGWIQNFVKLGAQYLELFTLTLYKVKVFV